MAHEKEFMIFLDDLLNRHDEKLKWLSDQTGLDTSTFRKWRQGQRPSTHSLDRLGEAIKNNMPDDLPFFDEAVKKLKSCAPSPEPAGIADKIKELEAIVDSRNDLDMEAKGPIKEIVAKQLIKYDFEFAKKIAHSITVSDECPEYEEGIFSNIPKYIQPQRTSIEIETLKLVDGFYLDKTILSNDEFSDDIYLFLWHKEFPCARMCVGKLNKDQMEKKFGDVETALTDYVNSEEFAECILEYMAPHMSEDDEDD